MQVLTRTVACRIVLLKSLKTMREEARSVQPHVTAHIGLQEQLFAAVAVLQADIYMHTHTHARARLAAVRSCSGKCWHARSS